MSIKSISRQLIYRSEKAAQRGRFASLPAPEDGWPVLLGISVPKSGTHLLDQILVGFSKAAPFSRRLHSFFAGYEGESGRKRSVEETVAWVDALEPLDVASAHLFAWEPVVRRVASPAFIPYFIFRDPRDVAVSHVFYVTEMEKRHVHHEYYAALPDFNARLRTSILGRRDAEVEFPDIAGRFAPYLGWLEQPSVMLIHFEDLVNDRAATLGRIVDHFLRRVPLSTSRGAIVVALESSINPQKSPTFRSGRTGEWKQHFTPEHKKIFKDVAGDLLVRLGYETDNDW
ncbi:MAG: sulfotransferase domain-containing protein [Bacteroidota bacterium]